MYCNHVISFDIICRLMIIYDYILLCIHDGPAVLPFAFLEIWVGTACYYEIHARLNDVE